MNAIFYKKKIDQRQQKITNKFVMYNSVFLQLLHRDFTQQREFQLKTPLHILVTCFFTIIHTLASIQLTPALLKVKITRLRHNEKKKGHTGSNWEEDSNSLSKGNGAYYNLKMVFHQSFEGQELAYVCVLSSEYISTLASHKFNSRGHTINKFWPKNNYPYQELMIIKTLKQHQNLTMVVDPCS